MHLLLTGAWQDAQENIARLQQMGHEVAFAQMETDPLPCPYEWVEGVVCNGLFQTHPIRQFLNLRFIQLTSAGYDRVPMDYVREHGIEIRNARGVYSVPMAEFVLGGVLQLYKQAAFFRESQQQHRWEKRRDLLELAGKTVCIVGCGDIGTECARRFGAFGCRVLGVNRTVREVPFVQQVFPLTQLDRILAESDVVVLTLPAVPETFHLMDAARLSLLKPTAILVNVSRGSVVDTDALLAAAPGIGGVVLDVFETEPLAADSPLWELPNCILTPHNSFVGEGNRERMNQVVFENLNR